MRRGSVKQTCRTHSHCCCQQALNEHKAHNNSHCIVSNSKLYNNNYNNNIIWLPTSANGCTAPAAAVAVAVWWKCIICICQQCCGCGRAQCGATATISCMKGQWKCIKWHKRASMAHNQRHTHTCIHVYKCDIWALFIYFHIKLHIYIQHTSNTRVYVCVC